MKDASQAETQRIADLRRRLEKDPGSRTFFDLAREYHESGRFQEAADICARGLRQHASYLSARVLLGRIYFDMGRSDDAREAMETALQQAPDNLVARRVLAQICLEQGDLAGALERFRALLAFSPTDTEAAARIDQIERRLSGGEQPVEVQPADVVAEPAPAAPPALAPEAAPQAALQPEPARPSEAAPAAPTREAPVPPPPSHEPAEPVPVLAEATAEASSELVVEVLTEELEAAGPSLEPGVLATPTLAEIYMDQGLTDRATLVYREILKGDPGNAEALARLADIERAQAPPADPRAESARRRIQALGNWLEAIRGGSRA